MKSIICENQPIVFFLVESKWLAVHRLCNILQHTFASVTIFFIVSTQQQHSKIYLCRLAIPDNFHLIYYILLYVNPMLFQQEIMSDKIHLQMVSSAISLPWRTFYLVLLHRQCAMSMDKLSKDRSNKLTTDMLADFFIQLSQQPSFNE